MIRALYRHGEGQLRTDVTREQFSAALQDASGLLWVDLANEPPELCESILQDIFGFHPLAVDDALRETHVPKLDDWGPYLYLVLHAVVFDKQDAQPLHTHELDIFLGQNYLVTYHTQPIAAVERVQTACQRDERYLSKGSGHVLYRVADELVADYMPVVDRIDEAIDDIEDQVFASSGPAVLEQIFTLKRSLLHLRRIIDPQREVLNKLARGDYAALPSEERMFFRDIYDHLVRLHDITESLRDLAGSALDTYLSVVNNRMNEVMKTLTVITTLFMPIAFVTGFFGMNFFQPVARLDTFTDYPVFVVTMLVMVAVPIGMYAWIKKRAWM
jgi:magnesium transporter